MEKYRMRLHADLCEHMRSAPHGTVAFVDDVVC